MRRAIFAALAAVALGVIAGAEPADAGPTGYYEVTGVEGDDMLKMRAGPGVGFQVIVGLPNGTVLQVHSCDRTGGTRWCKASLKQAHGLKGYVSWAYLRQL
ncbi:SH3 domain-containing protein [Roseovarius sp. M141]|uniref:SH3 domain-containing protein n=1 Tax=Roseovarius sp. M141 TaxID=2583806 RepID=UPI0020CD2E82|nr:SH3 domain-containing protein [Roseovarius sp. M141]MCQ0092953.1 SH3 domain-containing protein [Roseovarius sp. M141]